MSGERILCVDDDERVRTLIVRLVVAQGHDCVAVGSVEEARRLIDEDDFSVVLCDIGLPGRSGLELLEELAQTHPEIATVMVTGHDDPSVADAALRLGAYGYVTKPFAANDLLIDLANALHRRKLEAERRRYETELERAVEARTEQLRRAYLETVVRLGRAIEYHDGETGAHVERVGSFTRSIALALDEPVEKAEFLRLASPLHDIGKIAILDRILRKAGPLTTKERHEMQRHTEIGHELLAGSGNDLLELAATIAWTHHERWDGAGYPRGLAGDEIPLAGRIVAVADHFDALTSDRPYRSRLALPDACAAIESERGTALEPRIVDAFLSTVG